MVLTHILSNMQDRLLQLVQIIQYVAQKVDFQLIISNECVPTVTINHDTRISYQSMGFDTASLTQDGTSIGVFGITTDHPISIVKDGDRYTWAKYGYHILRPDMSRECKLGHNSSYRHALTSLLSTDLYNMKHFQIEFKHGAMVYEILHELLPDDATGDDKPNYYQRLISDGTGVLEKLKKIATEASVIPLSVFTNMFHQRYPLYSFVFTSLRGKNFFKLLSTEAIVTRASITCCLSIVS
jgi:hypothetical protein